MGNSGILSARVYSRIPSKYDPRGTTCGSNEQIFSDIVKEIKEHKENIKEVHLALYLFNNVHLYQALHELAKNGVRVVVTSLPLTGYDRRKIKAAASVYKMIVKSGTVELLIYPHMYMWYGAKYAGGGASYSFHVKAGLIKYEGGTSKVFLTSGNLAPGDPTHSETAIFILASKMSPCVQMYEAFFNEIEGRAKLFSSYTQQVQNLAPCLQQVFDFAFVGGLNQADYNPAHASSAFFTAPFIMVGSNGSNHFARKRLVDIILSARKRALICAQHVHDLAPFNGYADKTIIGALTEAKKKVPEIDARVLKQVASSGLADKRRAAFVEGHLYHAGVPQRINKLIHDKFIVADDMVIVTTSNFTATQFGWGQRQMEYTVESSSFAPVSKIVNGALSFFKVPPRYVKVTTTRPRKGLPQPKVIRTDIFSEVNAFVAIEDRKVAGQLAGHFDALWNHSLSGDVVVPV